MAGETGDPTDALEVLGDETRMTILRELAEAEEPLPFSTLRERVGVRDSGKFNYHLGRLCEYFVRQTEGAYELSHAGTRVIASTGAAAADTSGADDTVTASDGGHATTAVGDGCPVCGDEDCEKLFHVHLTPPWR